MKLYAVKRKSKGDYVSQHGCWSSNSYWNASYGYSPNLTDARFIDKLSTAKRHLTTFRNYHCDDDKDTALDHVIVEVILSEGNEVC